MGFGNFQPIKKPNCDVIYGFPALYMMTCGCHFHRGGHVESRENKKLCFCTANLALNSRVGEASRAKTAFYSPESQHGRRVRKVYGC